MRTGLTIAVVALVAAAVMLAGVMAPRTRATSTLCHSTALSIKAASTVKAGKRLTVSGAEAKSLDHSLTATLQYRRASVARWSNGASVQMITRAYSLRWKAPAKKGRYRLRVQVEYEGEVNTSATRTVTVN